MENEIFEKISALPEDSEFRFIDFFKDYDIDNQAKFDLLDRVLDLCESNGIIIENTQEGMILGMPWVYVYKKMN